MYDFGAQNDVRGDNAHAKASVRYRMLKHVDLIAGYDNFLNKKAATIFGGVGVTFVDDDLKYIVGGASSFVKNDTFLKLTAAREFMGLPPLISVKDLKKRYKRAFKSHAPRQRRRC